ncbi:molybdopterin cofactor-binding domain-containing protein [Methylobacterium nonmethylotrophicum]|uniref:Xanthine dehydrogenase family protein molybdopterin-binding subunit n=1 Tax=Methylobacterium nonmethylotrophicum TaxID=1141884 RepID=A0A4Z0NGP2_9HYPH|nr:molybdopterin cofactor-binding domain-containing protein [Methylobacterium nonmethylotrophicum]TGD95257.1 xanthine dehydrogenase family protein molybdopterin-binding subunit [Methylobacterium nonmethylotrophicum]
MSEPSAPLLPASLITHPFVAQWVAIRAPDRVAIFSGKVELGQGIAQALVTVAAATLGVAAGRIDLVAGDTDHTPDEWYTAGSQSVEVSATALRLACLTLRRAALEAVRSTGPAAVEILDGHVLVAGRPTGESYWTLGGALPQDLRIAADPQPWTGFPEAGRGDRSTIPAKLGAGYFIQDIAPPDLVHARVIRPPRHGSVLLDIDEAALAALPGIRSVVRDGAFLALVADREWDAVRGARLAAAHVRWQDPMPQPEAEDAVAELLAAPNPLVREVHADAGPEPPVVARRWRGTFSRQPLSHAPIGPSCALAAETAGRLTVWTHSQGVFQLRGALARLLGLEDEAVRVVHVPGAGCYGHNGADDAACDAALIARRLGTGHTVRVVWSREDEFRCAPLGPAMHVDVEAGLDAGGGVAGWRLTVRSAPHGRRPGFLGEVNLLAGDEIADGVPIAPPRPVPPQLGGGGERNAVAAYSFPQQVTHAFIGETAFRTSSLRALGAHLNVVAIEGALDELAAMAGMDPVAFRLAHLAEPRARTVVERAAAAWGDPQARAAEVGSGRARGFAYARYKNKAALMACIAEVEVDEEIRLLRVSAAVECGRVLDRDGCLNQVEGGIVQSASFTLREAVALKGGRAATETWEDYPILGFAEVPEITVELLESGGDPLGVGEVATGPTAAAIANAASRALGLRLGHLPLTRDRLIAALAEQA